MCATERMRLKTRAHRNPSTWKPGTMAEVSMTRIALITKIKSPMVSTVIGRVRITSNGFTKALIRPRTKATTNAATNPDTVTPGNIYATTSITKADIIQFISIFIGILYHKIFNFYSELLSLINLRLNMIVFKIF